ncbi:hemerythrin domain-containing protein [Malonomonas rubra]|nr:hemerythrin domain-containing protein [Malonomonas rubra]
MVWYGIHKTGIPDIDLEHANIDTYLELARKSGMDETVFNNLIRALTLHFEHEESLCRDLKLNFTDEHRAEHQRLAHLLKLLPYDEKNPKEHLEFFKQMLISHISDFDRYINKAPD